MTMPTCELCGKVRTDEKDYDLILLMLAGQAGWYSSTNGDGIELCPGCLALVMIGDAPLRQPLPPFFKRPVK